jgi:hypothetical protein
MGKNYSTDQGPYGFFQVSQCLMKLFYVLTCIDNSTASSQKTALRNLVYPMLFKKMGNFKGFERQ